MNGVFQSSFWGKHCDEGGRFGLEPFVNPEGNVTPNPKQRPCGQSTSFAVHLPQTDWHSLNNPSELGKAQPQDLAAGFQEQKFCG